MTSISSLSKEYFLISTSMLLMVSFKTLECTSNCFFYDWSSLSWRITGDVYWIVGIYEYEALWRMDGLWARCFLRRDFWGLELQLRGELLFWEIHGYIFQTFSFRKKLFRDLLQHLWCFLTFLIPFLVRGENWLLPIFDNFWRVALKIFIGTRMEGAMDMI